MKKSTCSLVDDLVDGLDGALELADQTAAALLAPYTTWPDDDLVEGDTDPATGRPVRVPRKRVLGPPFDLAVHDHPDPLERLVDRLEAEGGPTRVLARVRRATARLEHLLISYTAGRYHSSAPSAWRLAVTARQDDVTRFALEARTALEAWEAARKPHEGPDSRVLQGVEFVSAETIVEMEGGRIGLDAARKRIKSGRYGQAVPYGKHRVIPIAAFRAALAAPPDAPRARRVKAGTTDVLARLPRRRGRRRRPHHDPATPPREPDPRPPSGDPSPRR
jgi:hypothetical protein